MRSVANKRVKKRATAGGREKTLRLQRIKRGLRLLSIDSSPPASFESVFRTSIHPERPEERSESTFTPWIFHVEKHGRDIESLYLARFDSD